MHATNVPSHCVAPHNLLHKCNFDTLHIIAQLSFRASSPAFLMQVPMNIALDDTPHGRWFGRASLTASWPMRYVGGALIVHALPGWAWYQIGPRQHELKRQAGQLAATVRMSSQVRTEQRVQDLAQIKRLLEQSRISAKASAATPDSAVPEPVQFSATSIPKQPEELLKQARELAASIDGIDKDNQAEELARMLKISEQEARARLADEKAAAPPPASTAQPVASAKTTTANRSESAIAAEIGQLEQLARAALKRRQDQLTRQASGVGVDGGAMIDGALASGGAGQGQQSGPQDAQQQIGAFMQRDSAVPSTAPVNNLDSNGFDRGFASIPAIDAGPVHPGEGRVIGPGGEYAKRVYLNSWYLIGPFQGSRGSALFGNPAYPPERSVLLDAVYRGKDERLLRWRYITGASYPFVPPDIEEGAVYYGYTELASDRAQQTEMWVGADDDARVWVNDKLVWAKGNRAKLSFISTVYGSSESLIRTLNMNEGKQTVQLRKGRNKFLFKLSNGPSGGFISIVLTRNP